MNSKLSRVSAAVFNKPWYVIPETLDEIAGIVRFHLAGGRLTHDELQARLATAAATNGPRRGQRTVGAIAVLPVYGVIMPRANLMTEFSGGATVSGIRESFREAMADDSVGSILLDFDSPGGYTDGVEELATEIREARGQGKPIVSIADYTMASAAYYLGSQADEVVASPSAMVGWIGTVLVHQEYSKADEAEGITTTIFRNPEGKYGGNEYEPLSEKARADFQQQIDDHSTQFVAAVSKGRGVSTAKVNADFGQGGGMSAARAKAAGLVDRVETLDATIRRLAAGKGPAGRGSGAWAGYTRVEGVAAQGLVDDPTEEEPPAPPVAPDPNDGGDASPADDPEGPPSGEAGTPPDVQQPALEDLELRQAKNRARAR